MDQSSTSPKSKSSTNHHPKSSDGQGPDQVARGLSVGKLNHRLSPGTLQESEPVTPILVGLRVGKLHPELRPGALQGSDQVAPVLVGLSVGRLGRSSVASQPSISTSEIVAEYLESKKPNLAPDSFITYRCILQSFARAFPDLPTQPEPIEKYMAWRRRPAKDGASALKAGTRRLMYSKLSDFYEFAHRRHGVPNVMELIDRPAKGKGRESDYLNLEQLRAVLEAIPRRPRSKRLQAYVYLCAGQGLRAEEPLRLNVEDIFPDRLRVKGKERLEWSPLLTEVRDALLEICQGRPGHEPIFITETTRVRLGRKMAYNEVRDLLREAGITGLMAGPKVFRHSFATLSRSAGCDRASVSALLRHCTEDVSDFYLHLSVEERLELLRPKLEQFSPLRQVSGHLNKSTVYGNATLDSSALASLWRGREQLAGDAAALIPELLDRLVALGELAKQISASLGGNGHRAEKLAEVKQQLQGQARV